MMDYLAMGGYAWYVWPSYALAAIVLIANIVAPIQQRNRILTDIARKLRRARKAQS